MVNRIRSKPDFLAKQVWQKLEILGEQIQWKNSKSDKESILWKTEEIIRKEN
jgi:hypothetical protein